MLQFDYQHNMEENTEVLVKSTSIEANMEFVPNTAFSSQSPLWLSRKKCQLLHRNQHHHCHDYQNFKRYDSEERYESLSLGGN